MIAAVVVAEAVVAETTFDWVDWVAWVAWVAWDFVFGSVRQMGCSLDCRRDYECFLALLWAPLSVKGSRHFCIGIVIWI